MNPLVLAALQKLAPKLIDTGIAAVEELKKNIPSLENEVTVRVTGQPGHTKQTLYFLALAAASAVCRQFTVYFVGTPILPPQGILMIEYDAAQNWVQATIRYHNSMLAAIVPGVLAATSPIIAASGLATVPPLDRLAVYNGPNCDVVGAPLSYVGGLPAAVALGGLVGGALGGAPGIPGSPSSFPSPPLPWNGRTILTPCPTVTPPVPSTATTLAGTLADIGPPPNPDVPTPNPKPPGDNRSRGAVPGSASGRAASLNPAKCCPTVPMLVQMVYSALSFPGNPDEELFVPPVPGPTGG